MGGFFVALVIGGWIVPWLGYFIPVCMIGGIAPAFIWGRRWCDWWCARGSFFENAVNLVSPDRPLPKFFRATTFRVAVLAVLFTIFGTRIWQLWGDWLALGGFFMTFLTVTTIVGIALGMIFQPRAWCAFCPIGTLSQWAGGGTYPIRIVDECIECGRCSEVCPMGIDPSNYKEEGAVTDGDCIKCGKCVASCPQSCLAFDDRQTTEAA